MYGVQIYCAERYRLFGDRGNSNCLAGGNTDSLQGTPFAGHDKCLRAIGLTVVVIGWLYLFGGRSGARQFVVASVIDRFFRPAVLLPVAIAGVFPRLFLTFTIVDELLAVGAWMLLFGVNVRFRSVADARASI